MTTTITTSSKRPVPLVELPDPAARPFVTWTDSVAIAVIDAPPGAIVQAFDCSGAEPVPIGWCNPGGTIAWHVPAGLPAGATELTLLIKLQFKSGAPSVRAYYPIDGRSPAGAKPPATKPPVSPPPPVGNVPDAAGPGVPVPGRPLVQWGTVASVEDSLSLVGKCAAVLAGDGGRWLRLWHAGWGMISAVNAGLITMARGLGVKVVLCVQQKDDPKGVVNFGSPDIAGFVARNAALLQLVEYVEAGNELNIRQYRPDDLGAGDAWVTGYVTRWLKPLSIALRKINVKVMATSLTDSWSLDTYLRLTRALVAAGATDLVDAVALHLYWRRDQLATLPPLLKQLSAIWGGLPLHVTEAAPLGNQIHDDGDYAAVMTAYLRALVAGGVTAIYVYRGTPHTHGNWPVSRSLVDAAGKPTAVYAAVIAAIGGAVAAGAGK